MVLTKYIKIKGLHLSINEEFLAIPPTCCNPFFTVY